MPTDTQLGYRQIIVGRFPAGLKGLDEVFASLYATNTAPTDELGAELVARVREHNYIPASSEAEFAAALVREYRKYCEQKESGQSTRPAQKTWRGIPREQVPWFPMLDEALCDGCDKCLDFCSSGVYAKRDSGVVYVVDPLNCVVGCDACARLCRHGAITFPPRSMLRTLAH
jgi:NAD-dependent dihydropyrimidine dehydrogenase PreA subunit